ncbi:MAG: hypothetical protein JWQ44_932 [Chthoniobacter sp.]|nr:hypothetical protein [Chthoniobacter sp.]
MRFEAWRHGVSTQIPSVTGSLYEPIVLQNSIWIFESPSGPLTRVEIKEARAVFNWRALLSRGSTPWFRALELDGVTGKIQVPTQSSSGEGRPISDSTHPRNRGLPGPERIAARNVDFVFESDGYFVRLQNAAFSASEVEPGTLNAGQVIIRQPWLNRTFRNISATTKLDGTTAGLANVTLEPGVQIQSLVAEFDKLARGELKFEMQMAGFGGGIRIETQTLASDGDVSFEAFGTFSQVNIGRLASFLGLSEAAGGTIKDGKFSFRGPPKEFTKATVEVRVEATNFQWESRQWDSLVLGAKLLNGRVQIPVLALSQGHNTLNLNGDFALPAPDQQWWQSEFALNINAQIENLTELSALMLPEFKYAAGKAKIDGSVRGKDQSFAGQIIVSGSDLQWRNAPVEDLHATLKLNGNELQLSNLSLFNDGDYVRGRGVVNILGDKQYWGELRGSIAELGKYSALLQKPIIPEPLAGGAVIDWSGEGSAKGHTGKFLAKLGKVRPLGPSAALLHPINADLEGTYQPGAILFSRFALSDDRSSFTANVSVGNRALSLQKIRFMHDNALQLEGDALLPLDLWKTWPNNSLATLLDEKIVGKVTLTAYGFDLHAASLLTGWNFPITGVVRGSISAEGPGGAIQSKGELKLADARIPLGWSGLLLTDVNGEGTLSGQTLEIAKLTATHPGGDVSASGQIDFANLRDPALKLAMSSDRTELKLFPGSAYEVNGATQLALEIEGPLSTGNVRGVASLLAASGWSTPDLAPVITEGRPLDLPPLFTVPTPPWSRWTVEVAARTAEPMPVFGEGMTMTADVQIAGPLERPALTGGVTFANRSDHSGLPPVLISPLADTNVWIELAQIDLRPAGASFTLRGSGNILEEPFTLHVVGSGEHSLRFIECDPPLTPELVWQHLRGEAPRTEPRIDLRAPAGLTGDAAVYEWNAIAEAPIETAPIPATPPEPAAESAAPAQ